MKRILHVAAAVLGVLVLAPGWARAHFVETGFYECSSLGVGNVNVTANGPVVDSFIPSTDTLLILENSSQTAPTCACFVVYDAHQNRIGAFLTNLSPQDNDTYDVCSLANPRVAQPLFTTVTSQTGTIEVITANGSCARNPFAGTSFSGPSFSATTASWVKLVSPLGAPFVVTFATPSVMTLGPVNLSPVDLKVVDTSINNGSALASICAKTGVVVDDTSTSPQCVEGTCDGTIYVGP